MKDPVVRLNEILEKLTDAGILAKFNEVKSSLGELPDPAKLVEVATKIYEDAKSGKHGRAAQNALKEAWGVRAKLEEIRENAPKSVRREEIREGRIPRNNGSVENIFTESDRVADHQQRATRALYKIMGIEEKAIDKMLQVDAVPTEVQSAGPYACRVYKAMKHVGRPERECVALAKASAIKETRDDFQL